MVDHLKYHLTPSQLDTRDPDYANKYSLWAGRTECDLAELIAATRETIASSRALIVEADRILANMTMTKLSTD